MNGWAFFFAVMFWALNLTRLLQILGDNHSSAWEAANAITILLTIVTGLATIGYLVSLVPV